MADKKFQYEYLNHYNAPSTFEYEFKEMVQLGWRLVCVTKVSKDNFVSYWEKPVDD